MHLNANFRRAATLLLFGLAGAVHAQSADPTRPPVFAQPPQAGAAPAPEAPPEAAPSARIIVTSPSRSFVVVDGFMVRVGQTYRGAKLIEVSADHAVWLRNGAREIDYGGGRIAKAPASSRTQR